MRSPAAGVGVAETYGTGSCTDSMAVDYDGLRFEHLGHASVRIETPDGTIVYIDPWGDVLDRAPHDADIVFVTHDDFDHYDPDGIDAVAAENTTVVTYDAIDTADLDRSVTEIGVSGELDVDGIEVLAVPAYNDPAGEHVRDSGEPFHAENEVIGLVLTIGETTVYFPSDTDFLDEHRDIRADVFIPPIGGHYTMDRHEAAEFAESVNPSLVLPVHYNTFDAIETDVDAFVEDLSDRGLRATRF